MDETQNHLGEHTEEKKEQVAEIKPEIKPDPQKQAGAKSKEELEDEEKKRQELRYGKPVPGVDIPTMCPIGKPVCLQSHDLCDFWYAGGCNQDFDSTCKSGACNMPSAHEPNATCPYCKHPLTIDYDRWRVIK